MALLACLASPACAGSSTITAADLAGKRVMVLGDSITQNGTYVSFVEYYLQREHPQKDFDIVSIGLASETVSGLSEPGHAGGAFPRPCLHERLGRALERVKPKVILVCYGMNDGIYLPSDPKRMEAFRNGIGKVIADARAAGARVVLVTPPVFDTRKPDVLTNPGYDAVLAEFAKWEMTAPFDGVGRIDLHTHMRAEFDARRKANPNFHFAADGVHPDELGHLVMARAILSGLGVNAPVGDLDQELARVKADPVFQLVARHRESRSGAWLNYVGYTRERTVPPGDDISAAEKAAADLQRQIDESPI